jgi:hypothetical protein
MTRAICLFLLCLSGCTARNAVPSLSVRGLAVVHQRDQNAHGQRAADFALQLQLTFATDPPKRARAALDDVAARAQPWDSEPCAEPALCEWARLAEESALLALGIAP